MATLKQVSSILLIFSLMLSYPLQANEDIPHCFKKIQSDFFRENTILTALGYQYQMISQSQWSAISNDLVAANKRIPELMRKHAKQMPRNPLKRPFQSKEAEQLLQTVAWEIFIKVMKAQYITDPDLNQSIFSYIWQQESPRINICLPKEKK